MATSCGRVGGIWCSCPVNQSGRAPLFSYSLPRGRYLIGTPPSVADWTQSMTERWLVPIGGGVGNSFNIGKQAVDSNLTLYWNAIRPANQSSPKWQLNVEFTFLFPIPKHSGTRKH